MKRVLIGGGGHAYEVSAQMGVSLSMYVDDMYVTKSTYPLSILDFDECEVMIAIGNPADREKMVKRLPSHTKYFTFIHPTALILDSNITIGEGGFIGAYSVITTNISIGKHAVLNRMCQIGHDSTVGDYLSMMPGSVISGNCHIRDRFYLGTNSSVREKLSICDNVTIGLNSGVVKNITEYGIYVGSPAKSITQRRKET